MSEEGSAHRHAVADRSHLSTLIQNFRVEVWNGARSVTAIEVQDCCTEYAWEFQEWLAARGVDATVTYGDPDDFGYTDRTSDASGEGHAVVAVLGHWVDWAAAQYGYEEFPKVERA
jgi:hypothetical protein